ncbi:MAG: Phenylalanine--tRNA ligase beta subunit [Chroococcidiopsis cubana SAG 39.79]|uniref:Phenylalanine--tRNA ligase beta subunit n=1 Tax=Chroococcidiopsis cubana SAG 39.79 TaxID=388085 RepID=A0AB37UM60_9CYAN|nr:phenylalanine--tRNA ligase subunit beta [Chroococcidiopsis cubana]MDZ4875705.1 Phenylalanine--tRNA ligase beta subunit [Chroococcidiopsis cubana SAG 39.79]PSB65530.1 phenylalanine--tRNA ligase subunit beta [Chroococcidiopsis cubana CCALA 043]RUT12512.1 phenylalanine--tRNA ligase beta subunit [Chroococcidiopsis cubana SAG 39.79]
MRISLNWLREIVDITMTPEELAHTLTMAGFEVEEIEDRRTWADGVVIGKVLECQRHPNADKLSVTKVDIGKGEPLNIVCGAPNVRADIYVAVATIGTYLPKIDVKIRAANLRGVRSEGMICSLAELGLSKESAGIHIFDEVGAHSRAPLQLGDDVRPLLGLDDTILDLTATANRADALCMVGIAREVAALTGATLRLPQPDALSIPTTEGLEIAVLQPQACPAYIGTVIEGIKIAPSPEWLQQRLQAAGMRPINNVVDATNYIMLEWGQPLHAFDRDRLLAVRAHSSAPLPITIGVRFAESGESLKTLDGQSRNLTSQTLLITANDKPVALAGVMGGEATEVGDTTQNLLLEAALFDSVAIRRSARSLGLRTEASARYERGVNYAELELACRRAISLIQQIAGGTAVSQQIADRRPDMGTLSRSIQLRLDRVNQILGLVDLGDTDGELQPDEMQQILTALGCQVTPDAEKERVWIVTVPPYRYRDLEREIDLIEEIARVYGYDKFCTTLPEATEFGFLSVEQQLTRQIRAAMRAAGLTELMHYSLVKPGEDRQVVLANPLFAEYAALRTDLIAGLVDAFQYNLEQGNGALNGFEIGRIFTQDEAGIDEMEAIGGILGGDPTQGKWVSAGRDRPMSWYEAKGILDSVFQRLGLSIEYQPSRQDTRLHPGRTASLWLQGNRLGVFGQLHPQLRQERGLPDEVYVFQLDLDLLFDALDVEEMLVPRFKPYSTYPAADRDIAFFAPVDVSVAELERAIAHAGGQLLESVELFDEYRGQGVPAGQRSLAFRLVYRASDRTLTDAEVEPVHQKVRESLVEKFSLNLRS